MTVPVMHACGHDLHTASLVGAARLLAARRDLWRGTLLLIAQPAEETMQGAKAMLGRRTVRPLPPARGGARPALRGHPHRDGAPPAGDRLLGLPQLPDHHPRARRARRGAALVGRPGAAGRADHRVAAGDRGARDRSWRDDRGHRGFRARRHPAQHHPARGRARGDLAGDQRGSDGHAPGRAGADRARRGRNRPGAPAAGHRVAGAHDPGGQRRGGDGPGPCGARGTLPGRPT